MQTQEHLSSESAPTCTEQGEAAPEEALQQEYGAAETTKNPCTSKQTPPYRDWKQRVQQYK